MNKSLIKLEISAFTENISISRVVAAAFVAPLDPTVEEVTEIKTAVSEAVTNAIIHGYARQGYAEHRGHASEATHALESENSENNEAGDNDFVQIIFSAENRVVTIEVRDSGVGIENIESAREPLFTTKPELERSGMGFSVMESFMDSVEISSLPGEGTSVVLTKKINGAQQ
ncbi:MAG: anti-sigma F factor [Defluviitaleaceae bacterium]|nr:anti-sigma F factor [Defluviitaleaceae bacterium]